MSLNDLIAQGTDDSGLSNDVQTLNSLSLDKDQVAQQRAILYNAFTRGYFANGEEQTLVTAVAGQGADSTAFDTTATPAEQSSFNSLVAGPLVKKAVVIEEYVVGTGSLDIGNGALGITAQQRAGAVVLGDVRHDRQHADRRAGSSQKHRRAGPGAAARRGAFRGIYRDPDRRDPAPCDGRDIRRR